LVSALAAVCWWWSFLPIVAIPFVNGGPFCWLLWLSTFGTIWWEALWTSGWLFGEWWWCHEKLCCAAVTRFAWWRQDLHAIELLRARIGERTVTRMLDYWRVMCFTGYRLNWNSWIWIPFPVDSDCALLCSQVDRTRYSSIASGNNCIVQLCKCVSLHLKWALWIHPVYS
jgi:hypothetical protein